MCEIDQGVVAVAKEFFGGITATAFDDPRVTLLFKDAAEYVKEHNASFDVVIMDSSDPVGPAESLYQDSFLASVQSALRPGGILCMQGECMWLHLQFIKDTLLAASALFDVVDYAYTGVPTYPCGQIGFILCKGPRCSVGAAPPKLSASLRKPKRSPSDALSKQLKYYTPGLHVASFELPQFAIDALSTVRAATQSPAQCPWHSRAAVWGGIVSIAAIGALVGVAATKLLQQSAKSLQK
jgi:spermidine synthase